MKAFRQQLVVTVALAILAVLTGLVLIPFYGSSATAAYPSVKSVENSGVLWIFQAVHHWLSAFLICSAWVTIWFGLFVGAYRSMPRREWVGASLFVVLGMLFQLTGHILPWDVHAVRTAVVESGIAQGAPLVGTFQANLIRGGQSVGPQTLSVWFIAHVAGFSVLLAFLVWLVFPGIAKEHRKQAMPLAIFYLVMVIGFAIAYRPHLGAMATASDFGNYNAAPEWYILPMHEMLGWANLINPKLGFLATMVGPAVILAFIVLAPWIAGKPGTRPVYGIVLAVLTCAGVVGLTAYGVKTEDVASLQGPNTYSDGGAVKPTEVDKVDPALVAQGQKLFAKSGCSDCHTLNGKGGNAGPVLNGAGTLHPQIEWQVAHLENPKSMTPSSTMPSFSYLGLDSEKAIAEYITTLK